MDERIEKWLYDVQISIEEIDSYFEDKNCDFNKYKENLMLKRAVERNLEIIGEAINRIITRDPSYNKYITKTNAIIGLRNQVIHAYDNISDENIWGILTNHLPKLKQEISHLLSDKS